MRAPNGYGAVYKLPGNRRKPWTVRITTGYKDNGSPIVKYCGYYATKKEAFAARDEINKRKSPDYCPTFAEVAEQFNAEHFPTLSDSTIKTYRTALKNCAVIACKPINEIAYTELQEIVKSRPKGVQNAQRVYLNQVFTYADVRDWINKNPAQHLKIDKAEKSTMHYKFSHDEIEVLWQNADCQIAAFILLTIYTGCRPSELIAAEVKDDCLIIRQGKTKNAARTIPVHEKAVPLLRFFPFDYETSTPKFIYGTFQAFLSDIGILDYTHPETGLKQAHKPHDGRHTFTSQWKTQRLDDGVRAYLQGHTQKDIGGRIYTHYDIEILRAEVNKLVY